MDAMQKIQEQLQEYEQFKENRRKAVKEHYHKWCKRPAEEMTEDERIKSEEIRAKRLKNSKDYYHQHSAEIKRKAKERYKKNKNKSHDNTDAEQSGSD
jgi:hypothetical protein